MADSDPDYDIPGSDEDVVSAGKGRSMAARPKEREKARWEASAIRTSGMDEATDGSIEGMLGGIEEAEKRRR